MAAASWPTLQPSPSAYTNGFRIENLLSAVYRIRRCFICQEFGWCSHREPEVELALLERKAI